MICHQQYLPILSVLAIACCPSLVGLHPATASPPKSSNPLEISLKFPAGKNRGTPVTTSGGGARSDSVACVNLKKGELSLNALTPNYSNVATTASATPTLYFYIPPTKATTGELVITDENDREVYQTTFSLPSQSGIAKLTIKSETGLTSGNQYKWALMIVCDRQYRNRDIFIEGKLEYQALAEAIAKSLEDKKTLEKAEFYAQKGYWLDTLDNAAAIRSTQPADWTELLNSVGLEAMSDLPLVDCCIPDN